MYWETRNPAPAPTRVVLESGPIRLSVTEAYKDPLRRWQHLQLHVGQHTTMLPDDCMRLWPREALAMARLALDEFEAQLIAEENSRD